MSKYTNRATRKSTVARGHTTGKTKRRKSFSSNLAADYALMLQLYYLHKQPASTKNELKFKRSVSTKEVKDANASITKTTIASGLIKAFHFLTGDNKTGLTVASN